MPEPRVRGTTPSAPGPPALCLLCNFALHASAASAKRVQTLRQAHCACQLHHACKPAPPGRLLPAGRDGVRLRIGPEERAEGLAKHVGQAALAPHAQAGRLGRHCRLWLRQGACLHTQTLTPSAVQPGTAPGIVWHRAWHRRACAIIASISCLHALLCLRTASRLAGGSSGALPA